jgi:RimJ/RimL family protein N-acetyltransferase
MTDRYQTLPLTDSLTDSEITIRPPAWSEMAYVRWLWSDRLTMQPVGGPVIIGEDAARRWYARTVDPGSPTECFCLVFNRNNRPVGEVSFHRLDPATMTADFNIKIAHLERGHGYAKRALRLLLDFFFYPFGGRLMLDDLAPNNLPGRQLLLDFGFHHDPSVPDVFRMLITRDEWQTCWPPLSAADHLLP